MFIIDDQEFVGKKPSQSGAWLAVDEIKFAALLLNRIGYEIYEDGGNRALYSNILLANLKEALSRLVCRDERLKLFGEEFWVINKQLKGIVADMPLHEIPQICNSNLMQNVPWVYAFDIRAKLFQVLCEKSQQDNGYGYEVV